MSAFTERMETLARLGAGPSALRDATNNAFYAGEVDFHDVFLAARYLVENGLWTATAAGYDPDAQDDMSERVAAWLIGFRSALE